MTTELRPPRFGDPPTAEPPRPTLMRHRPEGHIRDALKVSQHALSTWAARLDALQPQLEAISRDPHRTVAGKLAARRELLETGRKELLEHADTASAMLAKSAADREAWKRRIRARALELCQVEKLPAGTPRPPSIELQVSAFFSLPAEEQLAAMNHAMERDDPRDRPLIGALLELPPAIREAKAPHLNDVVMGRVEDAFVRRHTDPGELRALDAQARHLASAHSRLDELDRALFRGQVQIPDLTTGPLGSLAQVAGIAQLAAGTAQVNLETEV